MEQDKIDKMVSILLVDPHEIVRKGIRSLIESDPGFNIVGEADDGIEALRMCEQLKPEVIVLELMSKGIGGLELLQQLQNRASETRTVVLSVFGNEVYVVEALRAGAQAYVLKESAVDELLTAIRQVVIGQNYLCSSLARYAFDLYYRGSNGNGKGNNSDKEIAADPYEMLSSRERQILHLIAEEDLSSSQIAERLFISRRTVESHRANIMKKLSVHSYANLIRYAVQKNLLPRIEDIDENEAITYYSPARRDYEEVKV